MLPILFTLVAASFGWQAAWIAGAVGLIVFALPAITLLWAAERHPKSIADTAAPARTAQDWTRAQVVRDPLFYAVLVGVLAPPFIGTTIFFHQDYFIELRGYDPLAFAGAFPLMAATTITFALFSGQLIDRYGALKLLPFFLLPLATASAVAGLLEAVWGVYLFMFLLGISYGFTSTLIGALWPEMYGTKHLGSVRAVVVAAMVFSTALGPGLTGALIDLGIELPIQLFVMSAWCLAACIVLALASPKIAARNAAAISG